MREAGQKIATTFRTFVDKETVDYSEKEKKFSKTEFVKKPFEAKKKLYQRMEQHLDEALDKVESLAKEPKFQYGAEAFEEQYKELMSQILKEPEKDAVAKEKER